MAWPIPGGEGPTAGAATSAQEVGRKGSGVLVAGVMMLVGGTLGVPACLVATLLTANTCGAFADGCSTYGQTSGISQVFLLGTFAAAMVAVAGLVLTIVGIASRSSNKTSR